MESGLANQYKELYLTAKNGIAISFQLATGSVKLAFNTALFVISCGSLVRWRAQRKELEITPSTIVEESDDSSVSSFPCEIADNPKYEVHYQIKSAIAKSQSTEALSQLIRDSEFCRKASWACKSKESEDVIIIPSLSLDSSELAKITAVNFYEERQLCTLFYLANRSLRLVYVTSQSIDKAILSYYFGLIERTSLVPSESAQKRLMLLSCNDPSIIPLTAKILRRPKMIQKIKNWVNPKRAHMICYSSSNLEKDLALQLKVPLFSNNPSLVYWGTKIGSRQVFGIAGVPFADGTELVYSNEELVRIIVEMFTRRNYEIVRLVVKLNVGFSGEGNAILKTVHFDRRNLYNSVLAALENHLEYGYKKETWETFLEKVKLHGVLVEEWFEEVVESPSCQALINPKGEVELLSTHQQVLGEGGMVYLGCEFPANDEYRHLLQDYTIKVGQVLASRGCTERFAVDYVVRKENGAWVAYAIEINLRWGGTSHPMIFAKYLTNAELTPDGLLLACDDQYKYYVATDNVRNEVYTGLTPEDFVEFINSHVELQFNSESLTGVVFHLISAISGNI
jgi:hypothetical protein